MNNKNTELLGQMDVKKALVRLSIPATIGMLVNATYNLVDSLFVGWGAGTTAIGALTLAFPIQLIVMAFALMIGIGGASVFSRAYGRNDQDAMYKTFNTSIRFGVMVAILVSATSFYFMEDLLLFFGATPINIGYATDYLSIILFGVTFQTISMIFNNFTRAEGRANAAMIAMVIGTGMNIILDPIFIFDWGFGLGVQGAAIATVISQISAAVFITYQVLSKKSILQLNFTRFYELDRESLSDVLKIGLPTFIRNAMGAFLSIYILNLIKFYAVDDSMQTLYTSMYGAGNRVLMFALMPGFGLVQGLAPIAGYNYGARKWDRLVDVTKYATKLLTIYFVSAFIVLQLGATFIFDIFSTDNDPVFIETGAWMFRIITGGLFLISFQIISGSIYQAFGYAKRALFISLSRQFIFFIPVSIVLTQLFQLDGLWFTFLVADILSGIVGLVMLVYEVKVLQVEAEEVKKEVYV